MKGKWTKEAIVEFGDVISGGTPSTNVDEFWNGEIVWITPADLSKSKYPTIDNSLKRISKKGLSNSSANLIPKGSIVMSSRAPIGYFAVPSVDYSTNQGCKSIKLRGEHEPMFHYYNFIHNVEEFKSRGEGTTFAEISKKEIEKVEVSFPPSPHQRKIAKILSTCDAVLEQTEATIAKYKAIKQGMMHDLFTRGIDLKTGKLRPKYEDAPELYKESKLGWVPKEWEVKELGGLLNGKPTYGINAPAIPYNPQYPVYIRITDIDEEGNFMESGKKSVNSPFYRDYLLSDGDIVFARTGATVGKTYLYNSKDGQLVFAGFLIKVSPDNKLLNSDYLKFYTETNYYRNWVIIMSQRSGQPGINGNEYSKLLVPKSKIEEQRIAAGRLKAIENKIQTEQSTLKKYRHIKAGLMQDLLSGKVEVNVDEED